MDHAIVHGLDYILPLDLFLLCKSRRSLDELLLYAALLANSRKCRMT